MHHPPKDNRVFLFKTKSFGLQVDRVSTVTMSIALFGHTSMHISQKIHLLRSIINSVGSFLSLSTMTSIAWLGQIVAHSKHPSHLQEPFGNLFKA